MLLYMVFELFWFDSTLKILKNINIFYFALAIGSYILVLEVVAYRFEMMIDLKRKILFKDVF